MVPLPLPPLASDSPRLQRELDAAALQACKSGSPAAQRAFIVCYQTAVFALLSRLLGHGADVEDLAQETFIRALRSLASFEFDDDRPPSRWLLTIAARLALDHHRRRQSAERTRARLTLVQSNQVPTPEAALGRQRLRDALTRAIEGLSMDHRAVVVMAEFHGLGVSEIARCLDVNENTIKTRLFRARAQLSAALAAHRDNHD